MNKTRAEALLTQEEGEQAVRDWAAKDWSVRWTRLERGHWEDIVLVIAQAQLAKLERLGVLLL